MKNKMMANDNRMLGRLVCVGLVLAGILTGMNHGLAQTTASESSDVRSLVAGNNQFALDLYARLRMGEGNICFSPYSISTALAMTSGGARGDTERQMTHTLHLDLPADRLHPAFAALADDLEAVQQKGQVKLVIANSLWPQEDFAFLPDYLAFCQKYYHTSITVVDYRHPEAACQTINDWITAKTNGKINDLLSPQALVNARMTLVNAIYFKGGWLDPFKTNLIENAPFHVSSGETMTVPLMQQTGNFGYAEFPGLQVLELPYTGRDFSMLVLLPSEEKGLDNLETNLTVQNLASWTGNVERQRVNVFLPKFKSISEFSLKDALIALGMPDAFSLLQADFSGMDGQKDLCIGSVVHKAFVDVNETGTEAAGATAVVMMMKGVFTPLQPTLVFRADHPFLFLIRDNHSGSILFLGRVLKPSAGGQ